MIELQDNLFAMTESLSSEDLTTAVLAYLLGEPSEHAYRTLFCGRVLGYHPPPVVSAVRFQADLGEYGRADLTIDTEVHKIIVENKFYASFSQSDQLLRYSRYLIDRVPDREGVMVLLTIKDRKAFYVAEIARTPGLDFGGGTSGISAAQAVESHFASLGVTFRVLT